MNTLKIDGVGEFKLESIVTQQASFLAHALGDSIRIIIKHDDDCGIATSELYEKFTSREPVKFKASKDDVEMHFEGVIEQFTMHVEGVVESISLDVRPLTKVTFTDEVDEPEGQNLRIVSNGHASNTKVFVGDTELKGFTNIEIDSIEPDGSVNATIKLTNVMLG